MERHHLKYLFHESGHRKHPATQTTLDGTQQCGDLGHQLDNWIPQDASTESLKITPAKIGNPAVLKTSEKKML